MQSPEPLPTTGQRLLALSGVAFAVLFLIGWFASDGDAHEDSLFGFGFFPGVLALVIWSIATSVARYRAVTNTAVLEP